VASFIFSQALTANQTGFNPLSTWQYERVPIQWSAGAFCRLLARATTTGVRVSVFAGSDNIQQRSPVQGGGTAGVTPSPLNTPTIEWFAAPGDPLLLLFDEVSAGTPTVDGIIEVNPAV
jgi:hypothetical protein